MPADICPGHETSMDSPMAGRGQGQGQDSGQGAGQGICQDQKDGESQTAAPGQRAGQGQSVGQKLISVAAGKPPGPEKIRLIQPTPNLQIAIDPRIPRDLQAFAVKIPRDPKITKVAWMIDDGLAGETGAGQDKYLWPLERGTHSAKARIWRIGDPDPVETPEVVFVVK
jgi:hypothetical protein